MPATPVTSRLAQLLNGTPSARHVPIYDADTGDFESRLLTSDDVESGGDHAELTHLDYASSGHTGFSPVGHIHVIADVSGLVSALGGKSDVGHTHDSRYYTESEADNLLANKANTTSLGSAAFVNADNAANNIPRLDGTGKLPTSVLPALAIGETFVVNTQAAMLALAAQRGDVAVRTDQSRTYILSSDSPSTLVDWAEVLVPAAPVQAVNGKTGNVVLTTTDIAEGSNLYYTTVRVQADAPNVTLGTASGLTIGGAGGQVLNLALATGATSGAMSGADKTKLDGIASGATANASNAFLLARSNQTGEQGIETVTGLQAAIDAKTTTTYVDGRIAAVVGTAPANLDTLQEIAAQLANDESAASALTTAVAAKAPTSRSIATSAPLTGGGDLSADRTIGISPATSSAAGSLSAVHYAILNSATTAPTSATLVMRNIAGLITPDNLATGIDAALLANGSISNTEFQYLDGVTSAIQTQLDGKIGTGRTLSTTAPLTGGGDLAADRTLGISVFVASGGGHAVGVVPDPGASAGTSKYLREDATWVSLLEPRGCVFDGGGSAIVAGAKARIRIPQAATIVKVTLIGDAVGTAVVDIKKGTKSQYDAGTHASIVASAPPTVTAAKSSEDATLTGWTTAVAADDIFEFSLTSSTTFTQLTVVLSLRKA